MGRFTSTERSARVLTMTDLFAGNAVTPPAARDLVSVVADSITA